MFHVCGYLTDEIRKGKHFAHAGMLIRNRMMTDKFWDLHSFLSVNFKFFFVKFATGIYFFETVWSLKL